MEGQLYDSSRPLLNGPSSSSRPLPDRLSSSRSKYGEPEPLKLYQKVFLSHSGVNKDFVCFLYKELCRRYASTRIAFFDIASLPKAKPISMENILEEARSSKLGVLVLTEEFFTKTPNPMRELEAFVASEVRLLPIFLGMTVDQFKEESRRATWEEQWRKWPLKKFGGSCVEETIKKWRHALDIVATSHGLDYVKEARTPPAFVDRIVKEVTRIIPPLNPPSQKEVYGKDRLCQTVNEMYKECESKRLSAHGTTQTTSTHGSFSCVEESHRNTFNVVGIYGFAGIGKTTLSKCLCNSYFAEFNGRVCYLDLGWSPSDQGSSYSGSGLPPSDQGSSYSRSLTIHMQHMQHVLSTLTDYTNDFPNFSGVDEVEQLLIERLSLLEYPVFLAIDMNILHPDLNSWQAIQAEAKFYLSCKFTEGSKIFITSRSEDILKNLTDHSDKFSTVISYMPPLLFEEARNIFMHEMPKLHSFGSSDIEDEVSKCVRMCIFTFASSCNTYYHPWVLKSLAASVKRDQNLKESLRMLQSKGIVHTEDALEKVFKLLDITFTILQKEHRTLFLDFVLFYSNATDFYNAYTWIKRLYSHVKNLRKVFLQLKELCFIEKESWYWRPASLAVEFCRYKVTQDEYAQYYEVAEANAPWHNVIPRSVRFISVSGCGDSTDRAWADLDLRDVEAVEVLQLVGISYAVEVLLSRTTFARLRSLIVRVPLGTYLQFTMDENWPSSAALIPPRNLSWLKLEGNICFKSSRRSDRICSWLASCNAGFQSLRSLVLTVAPVAVMDLSSCVLGALRNLEVFHLSGLPSVQSIDMTTCKNLQSITLIGLPYLRSIGGLDKLTNLHSIAISICHRLPMLTISASNLCVWIMSCVSLKRISLRAVSSTKSLGPSLRNVDYHAGAVSSTKLSLLSCPSLRNVDALLQYSGWFSEINGVSLQGAFGHLLEAAAFGSSICKAKVESLRFSGRSAGFAGLQELCLQDAEHVGLFISALTTAHPKSLEELTIFCKEDGDCGCNKDAPQFGLFQQPFCSLQEFGYHCPQVRDFGSLAHSKSLQKLYLRGCTSVEVWPDFATITCLKLLDLSCTSLKEWPTSLLLLHGLKFLSMRGCKQLPAEELMKGISTALHEKHLTHGHVSCIIGSLQSLSEDLEAGERDRCLVMDTLDSIDRELVALFHQIFSLFASSVHKRETGMIREIMHAMWLGEKRHLDLPNVMKTTLGRLSFMIVALSFHERNERIDLLLSFFDAYNRSFSWEQYTKRPAVVRGLMGAALARLANLGWHTTDVNDGFWKDSFILFLKWFAHLTTQDVLLNYEDIVQDSIMAEKMFGSSLEGLLLRKLVREALCNMERVPIVAAAVGVDLLNRVIQRLEATTRCSTDNKMNE